MTDSTVKTSKTVAKRLARRLPVRHRIFVGFVLSVAAFLSWWIPAVGLLVALAALAVNVGTVRDDPRKVWSMVALVIAVLALLSALVVTGMTVWAVLVHGSADMRAGVGIEPFIRPTGAPGS